MRDPSLSSTRKQVAQAIVQRPWSLGESRLDTQNSVGEDLLRRATLIPDDAQPT